MPGRRARAGRTRLAGLLAVVLLLLLLLGGAGLGCVSGTPRAADLRTANGRLAPCPESPNCVCSEAPTGAAPGAAGAGAVPDASHAVAPLAFRGPAPAAWAVLLEVLDERPRTRIVLQTPDYLHVEFTSLVFRFVDDVEFRLDAAASVIHVRSASRVGYSDLGANRRRIEALRAAWESRLALP